MECSFYSNKVKFQVLYEICMSIYNEEKRFYPQDHTHKTQNIDYQQKIYLGYSLYNIHKYLININIVKKNQRYNTTKMMAPK